MSGSRAPSTGDVRHRQLAMVAIAGLLLPTMLLLHWFNRGFFIPDPTTWETGSLLTGSYDPPTEPVELFMNQGDGQVFAHLAQDPFVGHPERIQGGEVEQAYRLQRPLLGWAGWLLSGGQPEAVAWALIALMVLSSAALAVATAVVLDALGRSPLWGALVPLAPGLAANTLRVGPEGLGMALVVVGLWALWRTTPRTVLAVVCFGAAGLARESLLLVPVAIAVVDCWVGRPAGSWSIAAAWRRMFPLVYSVVPFVAWVLVLRAVTGAWPSGDGEGRLTLVPFGGLVGSLDRWGALEWVYAAVILVPAVVALVVSRDLRLRAVIGVHLAFAATFGEVVWYTWVGFPRVLLPLSVATLLALVARGRPIPWPGPDLRTTRLTRQVVPQPS